MNFIQLKVNYHFVTFIAAIQRYMGKLKIMDWVWLIYTFNEAALL